MHTQSISTLLELNFKFCTGSSIEKQARVSEGLKTKTELESSISSSKGEACPSNLLFKPQDREYMGLALVPKTEAEKIRRRAQG